MSNMHLNFAAKELHLILQDLMTETQTTSIGCTLGFKYFVSTTRYASGFRGLIDAGIIKDAFYSTPQPKGTLLFVAPASSILKTLGTKEHVNQAVLATLGCFKEFKQFGPTHLGLSYFVPERVGQDQKIEAQSVQPVEPVVEVAAPATQPVDSIAEPQVDVSEPSEDVEFQPVAKRTRRRKFSAS